MLQSSVTRNNLELVLLLQCLMSSTLVFGDFDCYGEGFDVIGSKLVVNTKPHIDKEYGEQMVKMDWVQIIDPPEAAICIKTFTIFYGRNWKWQSPRCIPTSAEEEVQFPCSGFKNRTRFPSRNISHTDPIILDICGEEMRGVHLDIAPIGPSEDEVDDDDDTDTARNIKDKALHITNETARFFLELDLPECSCPSYEGCIRSYDETYYWAILFACVLGGTGVLILVFILGRQRQVQEKKVQTHAWRGWRKVEKCEEVSTDAVDHDQELEAPESESRSSLHLSEFVNFDNQVNAHEEGEKSLNKVQESSQKSKVSSSKLLRNLVFDDGGGGSDK